MKKKSVLKKLIKEFDVTRQDDKEVAAAGAANRDLVEVLKQLLDKLDTLDMSIDYLSSAITGDTTVGIGALQKMYGRAVSPTNRGKRDVQKEELIREIFKNKNAMFTKSELKNIIIEEINNQLYEITPGEKFRDKPGDHRTIPLGDKKTRLQNMQKKIGKQYNTSIDDIPEYEAELVDDGENEKFVAKPKKTIPKEKPAKADMAPPEPEVTRLDGQIDAASEKLDNAAELLDQASEMLDDLLN